MTNRLLLLAVAALSLSAQTEKAQLSGTITDKSNATIPGARITMTNSGTGLKRSVQSNEAGRYVVSFLDPGTYEIVVQKDGFRSISRTGIKLDVAQVAAIDFALELGTITESIDVTAQAPLLDSGSASLGHLIENKTIVELPLNGRNAYSFATLVPGVRASRGFSQISYNMFNDQFVSINGSRANQNQFYMDGGTNTTAGFNGPGLFPSVDMVAEYKVQTNNFSAEFSNTTGGVVNVVTKTGTNNIHGSIYEFLRNDKLTANDFFVNRAGLTETPFRFNQFGATAGGPLIKNRTFLFGAYEGLRWTRQTAYNGSVPTAQQRAGDFSQTRNQAGALVAIYDPNTTRPDPARPGRSIRTVVPGNIIPASLIDPVSRNILRYTPLSNTAGNPVTNTNNYFLNASAPINKDLFSIRGDHSINDNHKIFLRYSSNDTTQVRPLFYSGDAGLASPTPGNDDYLQRQVVLSYTAVLRPTVVLELTSSFLRYWIGRKSPGLGFDPTQLGFPGYLRDLQPELLPCFPAVSVSGMGVNPNITDAGGGFLGNCANLGNSFDTFHESGNLTMIRGAHTLKAGGNYGAYRWSARNSFTANSSYSFAPNFTQGPDPLVASNSAGFGYASYLFGLGSGSIHSGGTGLNVQTVYWGTYFQDNWKVNSKLTLNLGVRYDNPRPWTERFNRITSWCWGCKSPLQAPGLQPLGGLAFPGTGGRSRSFYNSDNNNIAPRFGFAYELSRKMVIRGGFGLFYGPVQGGAVNGNSTPRSGFDASTTWVSSLDSITPRNPLSNPFPDGFVRASGSSLGLATLLGQSVAVMDPDRSTPYSEQWNLDIQHSLPGNWVIEAAYAGSRGLHLFGPLQFDQLPDQALTQGDSLRTLVTNPFFGQVQTGTLGASQVQRGQLLRPFPQFTGVVGGNSSYGASTYHSLQLKLERRFSQGLSLMASYTFSKVMDDVLASTAGAGFPGESFGDGGLQNYQNRSLERAPAQFDTPHYLALNGIWELPLGAKKRFLNQNRLLSAIAGGWQLNGLATFHSGAPLSLRTSSNTLGNFGGGQRPNWNGQNPAIGGPASQRLDQYFNTSAFSTPLPYNYGNVARLVSWLRGPGTANVDLSLAKNIPIGERFRLQFRFETFNSFNHPEFGPPNTSIGSPSAGVVSTQANTPRDIQFALKLMF